MDMQKNKAIAYKWFTQGWTGNLALADQMFPAEFSINGQPVGPNGPKLNVKNRLEGFPDLFVSVEDQLVAEDKVITRIVWHGTHLGEYSGVPATGKPVQVTTINIFRFVEDKVVESWSVTDQFGVLKQIGYLPPEVAGALVTQK